MKLKIEESKPEIPMCDICKEKSDYQFGSYKMGYTVDLCNNCAKQIAKFMNEKKPKEK